MTDESDNIMVQSKEIPLGETKMIIGYYHDRPRYKKSLLCFFGIHKATRYIIVRENGKDYFICKQCGKRYRIL